MRSWILLGILAGLTAWVSAQGAGPAYVPQSQVNAKKGQTANFTCSAQGSPLLICSWERLQPAGSSGPPTLITFTSNLHKPGDEASTAKGHYLVGDSLEKGDCGLRIEPVSDNDNGIWQCTLYTLKGGNLRGQVNLSILQKPSKPSFDQTLAPMRENEPSAQPASIKCYSTNGVPRPKFQWFIGEEPLTQDLGPLNETVSGGAVYTFQDLRNHRFTYKDHGKQLRCVVVHEALTDADMKEVSMPIVLNFKPRSVRSDGRELDRSVHVQANLGEEKIVSLNVTGVPRPRYSWVIDGKPVEEGRSWEEFEVLPMKSVGNGIYEVSLRIKSVEEDRLEKRIELKLNNEEGNADYILKISSSSNGSEGLSAGGILGIVLAILVLVILAAVGVVYTRAKGLLCFKAEDGTASEKERMDGGSTGGAAGGDEKPPTQGFASRLTSLYENLVKKKDKGAPVPVDEEAPKEKDAKETEGEKEPEKKGDDIVYAELDLARGAAEQRPEVVVRSDDKTEYAEIVGVVKDESKKTPEASPKK